MLVTLILTPLATRPYELITVINLAYSFLMFLVNSFCLTGIVQNRLLRETVVPTGRATLVLAVMTPSWSKVRLVPSSASSCLVEMERLASPQRLERASPRKPNVSTEVRSENSRNLEVACFTVRPEGKI